MNWFAKKEQIDAKNVEDIKLPDVVTFEQKPPVTQPIVIRKGSSCLGRIEYIDGKHRFRPETRQLMAANMCERFGYYEADDMSVIFLKLKELDGVKNDNQC